MRYSTKQIACIYVLLIASVEAQDIISSVSLLSTAYTSLVRGSKLLRDFMYGAGALSKLLNAFEDYLVVNKNHNGITDHLPGDFDISNSKIKSDELLEDELLNELPRAADEESHIAVLDPLLDDENNRMDICEMDEHGEIRCEMDSVQTTVSQEELVHPIHEGCGDVGFYISHELPIANMTSCCKDHDACYSSSCKSSKSQCDRKLRHCVYIACKNKQLNRPLGRSCRATSKLLLSVVMSKSSHQYKDAKQQLKCNGYVHCTVNYFRLKIFDVVRFLYFNNIYYYSATLKIAIMDIQ